MKRHHPDAWFDRQLAHVRACLAEADRRHTPQELAEAAASLAVSPLAPQQTLFAPPHAGLIPGGQPEPSGLADREALGA